MSLAKKAFIEYSIFRSKKEIEDIVINAAKNGNRNISLAALPCGREFCPHLIAWMEKEGLKVEHKTWEEEPTGLGSGLSDELVKCEKYIISW